tara:strand:+ start:2626 stop:3009 length:384 start_codon:yes stop_codon:yes gene_type:complete
MQQRIKDIESDEITTFTDNTYEAKTHEANTREANTQEANAKNSNAKVPKLNRRKTSYEREKVETYDLANILHRATEAMQNDINSTPDKKSAKADCLLPDPTDVAVMLKRIYQTEFPHVDIDTVFVSG